MAQSASPSLVRQLGLLFDGASAAGLSDRELLERFIARRDDASEAAFAALVARHGPMVLGVCRQLLGDRHHAEDVFQAVFLVLARKARTLRAPELLGNWLYGVTLRTARKARSRLDRLRKIEENGAVRHATADPTARADQAMLEREQTAALYREIDRLPDAFRAAVVLCYFESLTLDEAAQRLRWPAGTLRSRLARAREKLRRGLLRRGVALTDTTLAVLPGSRCVSASVSPLLCDTTTRAAIAFVARQAASGVLSATTAALAREVLRTMLFHKLRLTAMCLLLLAAVVTGAGFLSRSLAIGDEPEGLQSAQPAPVSAKPDPTAQRPAPGRMTVVGRVLDPQGKPVPGAMVMVYGASKQGAGADLQEAMALAAIGHEASDASGLFRIDAPRTSSATHQNVGAAAIAPGYGVGWVDLDLDAGEPAVDIQLRPEQVIEGRLFDLQGLPAQGVRVSVEGMGPPSPGLGSRIPGLVDGPVFSGRDAAKGPTAWPRPAITDAEGRFTIRGIGRDLRVRLVAEDPRFALQKVFVDSDSQAGPKKVTVAMEPAKIIHGRVTLAETGKPVPRALINILAYREGVGYYNRFETDAEGWYHANPLSTDRYQVSVYPPEGEPYLNTSTEVFAWTKGSLERRVDLVLSQGTVLHGKVTEDRSGQPVAGALLGYIRQKRGRESGTWSGHAQTGADGSYQLAVLPGPGTLSVLGPSEDYILQETGDRMIFQGQPGGRRRYAGAFIECNPKHGADRCEVNVVLRRGMTVQARVVAPDGVPVAEAWMFSQALLVPGPTAFRVWQGRYHGVVRNGRCELHGLAPDTEVPVFFLDPKRELGATAFFSGQSAAGRPPIVRLEPCGTATARLVDPAGKPIAGYRDPYLISMVVTPGSSRLSRTEEDARRLSADQDFVSRIDPIHYAEGIASDAQGRLTFPALIPGATYWVYDRTERAESGTPLRREFVAGTGNVIELGDIVIAKPAE